MALIAGLDAAKTGRASMVGALLIAAAISIGIDPAMRNPIGELGIDSACGKTRKPLMCTRALRAGSSVPGTLRDQDRKAQVSRNHSRVVGQREVIQRRAPGSRQRLKPKRLKLAP